MLSFKPTDAELYELEVIKLSDNSVIHNGSGMTSSGGSAIIWTIDKSILSNGNYKFVVKCKPLFNDKYGDFAFTNWLIKEITFNYNYTPPIIQNLIQSPDPIYTNSTGTITCQLYQGDGVITYNWSYSSNPSDVEISFNGNQAIINHLLPAGLSKSGYGLLTAPVFTVQCTVSNSAGSDIAEITPALSDLVLQKMDPINAGWNWIGFGVSLTSNSINTILNSIAPSQDDYIKSQTQYAQYSSSWVGSLVNLYPGEMYKLKTANSHNLEIIGDYINPSSVQVLLQPGWNWAGFVGQTYTDVNVALANFNATENDRIIGKDYFATYNPSYGWDGELIYLEPGKGYIIYSNNAATFYWGTPTTTIPISAVESRKQQSEFKLWQCNGNKYENNMTIVANVKLDEKRKVLPGDKLGAFVGDECVGIATAKNNEPKQLLFYMTVHGNDKFEESVVFKHYSSVDSSITELSQSITYKTNHMMGSIRQPFQLNQSPVTSIMSDNAIPVDYELAQNYPNPFNPSTKLKFGIPKAENLEIKIYNSIGQIVKTLVNEYKQAGYYEVIWNGKNEYRQNVSSGIYFYRMTSGSYTKSYKMLLIK